MIVDAIITIITLYTFFVYILVNDTFPKSRRKEEDCLQLQVINMNCAPTIRSVFLLKDHALPKNSVMSQIHFFAYSWTRKKIKSNFRNCPLKWKCEWIYSSSAHESATKTEQLKTSAIYYCTTLLWPRQHLLLLLLLQYSLSRGTERYV